jgi:hypothetical protein
MTAKNDRTAQKARVSEATVLETIDTYDHTFKETQNFKLHIPEQFGIKTGMVAGEKLSLKSLVPVIKQTGIFKEHIRSCYSREALASARQTENNRRSNDTR